MKKFKFIKLLKKVVQSKIAIVLIGVLIIYIMFQIGIGVDDETSLNDLIKFNIVVSVGLTSIIGWLLNLLDKGLNQLVEEGNKLTLNYQQVIKLYNKDNTYSFICKYHNKNHLVEKEIKVPLQIIAENIKTIKFIEEKKHYELPPLALIYYKELMKANSTSTFSNKEDYRLDDYFIKQNTLTLNISLCDEYHKILTNGSCDQLIEKKLFFKESIRIWSLIKAFKRITNG
ncbi:MAG: hypothetical protein MR270_02820 [Erysipelotrichaceae bacterium]|nr:hypothetical protein [Erysipelotrichaceae bacterium]